MIKSDQAKTADNIKMWYIEPWAAKQIAGGIVGRHHGGDYHTALIEHYDYRGAVHGAAVDKVFYEHCQFRPGDLVSNPVNSSETGGGINRDGMERNCLFANIVGIFPCIFTDVTRGCVIGAVFVLAGFNDSYKARAARGAVGPAIRWDGGIISPRYTVAGTWAATRFFPLDHYWLLTPVYYRPSYIASSHPPTNSRI